MRRAVVDVGSNSVLLVVAEGDPARPDSWRPLLETTAVTALGSGTKESGLLGEAGISATLRALDEAWRRSRMLGAVDIRAGVTMAGRIATNTQSFLDRAAAQGTPAFVLSGEEEAELGFQAVATDPHFANEPRLSIVDPGGQSTELVTATRLDGEWDVVFRQSYPIGTLGLQSTHLRDERTDSLALLRASAAIDDAIGLCYRPGEAGHVVVLGATGTNLVSIRERLVRWEPDRVHGAWLDFEEVSRAVGWLMPMSDEERARVPGLEAGRERTIHVGALILERFLQALRVLGCSVSVRGWRHALLASA